MEVAKCAIGIFMQRALIRSIGRNADVQVVTAAGLKKVTELGHRCTSLH
jgi:hypothetical protein